jgi:hypothetical protein
MKELHLASHTDCSPSQCVNTQVVQHTVLENCSLLGYYAASSGNLLPTFRDNLSVPFVEATDGSYSLLRGGSLK